MRALLAAAALLAASLTAHAQAPCGPEDLMLQAAKDHYGEEIAFAALDPQGVVIIITRADDGNWTLMVVQDGTACVIGAGTISAMAKRGPSI